MTIARYSSRMAEALDLDLPERLESGAIPGPWHVRLLDDDHAMVAIGIATEPDTGEHDDMATFGGVGPELVATTLIQAPPYVTPGDHRWHENAELIVALRNALPVLIRSARAVDVSVNPTSSTSA